jgi:acyl-CoA synthetase (AMP-forming)/AMP-acid ligase II
VIGVPDPTSGERVCACVVQREGAEPLSLEALRNFMESKQVLRQKIPEQLEILTSLPRNATGKILKFELRKRFGGSGR